MEEDPKDVTRGFTAVHDANNVGRVMYECNDRHRGIDGVTRKCSRRYRKHRIPNNVTAFCKHNYTIILPEEQVPVRCVVETQDQDDDEDYPLFKSLASSCCKMNLSLRQATSEPMMELINSAIIEGFQYRIQHPHCTLEDVPTFSISRYQLRNTIQKLATEREKDNINMLKKVKYVVAAVDHGTIHHRHMVFVNLLNPIANLQPCYLLTETSMHFHASAFAKFGLRILKMLEEIGVTLVGIVGDNLRAQIKGLSHWSLLSFQNAISLQSEQVPGQSAVLYVPCSCHTLNLVLTDLQRSNNDFDITMKILGVLTVFLRKSEISNKIGRRAPEIPKTRWVYAYDAAFWIMKHVDQINEVLTSGTISSRVLKVFQKVEHADTCLKGVPDQILELVPFLAPIKRLMLTFESDRTPLCRVFPLIHQTLKVYDRIEEQGELKYHGPVVPLIRSFIKKRFQETARWDLIVTSFALTIEGRYFIRKECSSDTMPGLTEGLSDDEEPPGIPLNEIDVQFIEDTDTEISISSDDDYDDEEEDKSLKIVVRKKPKETEEPNFKIDDSGNLINIVFNTIEDVAKRLDHSKEERKALRLSFHKWTFSRSNEFPNLCFMEQSAWVYWKTELQFKNMPILANIALRILSLPSSQASCERLISQNRQIIDSYRTKSKDDLVRARNLLRNGIRITQENQDEQEEVHFEEPNDDISE